MTEYAKLEIGQTAPDFTLLDHEGKSVSLKDYAGKKVILYFYPAASTPGCTKEACDFNDALNPFNAHGYTVIGISPDEPKKLAKFKADQSLNFPLLSDSNRAVHQAYGAFGEKSLYGRLYEGVLRSTFVLNESGVIELALYNVKATGHVAGLRKRLGIGE
jgi:peroxiredoxin Q/BCP